MYSLWAIAMHFSISIPVIWALWSLTFLLASTSPQTGPGSSTRNFTSTFPKGQNFYSVTQVKNPNWVRRQVRTSAVYAAPFLKSRTPMPANLSAALQELQLDNGGFTESRDSLHSRVSGQTVDGSDGE